MLCNTYEHSFTHISIVVLVRVALCLGVILFKACITGIFGSNAKQTKQFDTFCEYALVCYENLEFDGDIKMPNACIDILKRKSAECVCVCGWVAQFRQELLNLQL